MSTMSYCLFQNTVLDLETCLDRINDKLSTQESFARDRLIEICKDILDEAEHLRRDFE